MRKLRYNELDEMAWEEAHGCTEHPEFDEDWDEIEEDEPVKGIFGYDITNSHDIHEFKPGAKKLTRLASSGKLNGMGDKDDILTVVDRVLGGETTFHYEFRFWQEIEPDEWTKCDPD